MDYICSIIYTPVQVNHENLENVSVECFKETLSKVLGFGIIAGSLLG